MRPVPSSSTVRIWDLPTRVFHWALVFCFSGLIITGTVGGDLMNFHFRFGYGVLALLLFRFVWGFLGGRWSRFSSFLFSPKVTLGYLKEAQTAGATAGHSPLAALSVYAFLVFLMVQVASGLISDDEVAFAGPLTHLVSNANVSLATGYHSDVGKWILLGLVLLHLSAIIYYTRRKHRLVSAMVHGDKQLDGAVLPSRDDARSRSLGLILFLLCAVVAYAVSASQAPAF